MMAAVVTAELLGAYSADAGSLVPGDVSLFDWQRTFYGGGDYVYVQADVGSFDWLRTFVEADPGNAPTEGRLFALAAPDSVGGVGAGKLVLAHQFVAPGPSATFELAMQLPPGWAGGTVTVPMLILSNGTYQTTQSYAACSVVASKLVTLTATLTPYTLTAQGLTPGAAYFAAIALNDTGNGGTANGQAWVSPAVVRGAGLPFLSFDRLRIAPGIVLDDVGNPWLPNYLGVGGRGYHGWSEYSAQSSVLLDTSAGTLTVETFANLPSGSVAAYAPHASIAVDVDDAPYTILTAPTNDRQQFTLSLPPGEKQVRLTHGAVDTGSWIGQFIQAVYAPAGTTTFARPRSDGPARLVLLGDSITSGFMNDPTVSPFAARHSWAARLRRRYRSVINCAYGSALLADLQNPGGANGGNAGNLQPFVNRIAQARPDTIAILLGTNDYGFQTVDAPTFGTQYGELLDAFHAACPSAWLLACSPIPRGSEAANSRGWTLPNFRTQIQTAAAARSAWCSYLGFEAFIGSTPPLQSSADGLHPTAATGALIAKRIVQAIEAGVPSFYPGNRTSQWLIFPGPFAVITGGKISQISDAGSHTAPWVQAIGAAQPTYNFPDTQYNSNQDMSLAGAQSLGIASGYSQSQPSTIYLVAHAAAPVSGVAGFLDSSAWYIGVNTSGQVVAYAGTQLATSVLGTSPCCICVVFNGASSAIYVNSSQVAAATGTLGAGNISAGSILLGGGGTFTVGMTGKIAWSQSFAGVDSAAQRQQMFSFLAAAYGIAAQ
jgi:lysophospholipase L1-like esterase